MSTPFWVYEFIQYHMVASQADLVGQNDEKRQPVVESVTGEEAA
jgi:hypothetical protein